MCTQALGGWDYCGSVGKGKLFFFFLKLLQGLNYEPAILELLPTTCGSQISPSQCLCLFISLSDTEKAFATSEDSVSQWICKIKQTRSDLKHNCFRMTLNCNIMENMLRLNGYFSQSVWLQTLSGIFISQGIIFMLFIMITATTHILYINIYLLLG